MATTRKRILEFIDKNHVVTAAEISRAMRLTQANIRHHLSSRMDHGLVKIIGYRPALSRGRPSALYSLSSKYKGNNLELLLSTLLSEIKRSKAIDIYNILAHTARHIVQTKGTSNSRSPSPKAPRKLTIRLFSSVEVLTDLNYRAHWEAHSEGPQIILANCPYLNILSDHPELCIFDRYLIGELISNPVEQIEKLDLDERKIPYCLFRVNKQ